MLGVPILMVWWLNHVDKSTLLIININLETSVQSWFAKTFNVWLIRNTRSIAIKNKDKASKYISIKLRWLLREGKSKENLQLMILKIKKSISTKTVRIITKVSTNMHIKMIKSMTINRVRRRAKKSMNMSIRMVKNVATIIQNQIERLEIRLKALRIYIQMTPTITIIQVTTTLGMNTIMNTKVFQWRQPCYMLYVNFVFILADVIQSIGLIISALIIFFAGSDKGKAVTEWNNWHYCDPITTYIFSVIVLVSTWPVLKNCYFIIMESTPTYVQVK